MTDEKWTIAATSEQPLNERERKLVEQVYARMETFEQGNRPFHEQAKLVREILRLRDPLQDTKGEKEPTLQLQTLKSTFNNCVADQMQNLPEARILPETPEQEEAAMDLQDMVHYIVYVVNAYEELHRRRTEDLYGPGTAITQVTWDRTLRGGKGDIALIRWPVEAFLWDPKAENIQDARAVIKVSWHPMSWYAQHYPKVAPYIHAEEGQHNEVGVPEVQKDKTGGDEGSAALLEYWYRTFDASSRRYAINVAYCAGGALLEECENVYRHGMYPFIVDVHSTVEGSMAGEGMVVELAPMMRYINRYARYMDTNARMASKSRMLVRKNSGIDRKELADWSQDMIEGDSVTQGEDWGWLQHAPFSSVIAQQMLQMQSDLKMDSGANQYTRGESTAGVTSSKMLAALQTAGGKITSLRTDTLNAGFKRMVEQILWLMAEFYDDKRALAITGRDGKLRELKTKHSKLFGSNGPPPFMVQVEVNRRSPVRVEAQNEMFMQAYTMAAQAQQYFPLSALFRLLNVDGKDRLLPIIEEYEKHQQQMMSIQQQNEQLVEQLAQLQKEKESLQMTATQMTNALASVQAAGGVMPAQRSKVAQVGANPNPVNQARESMAGRPAGGLF